MILRDPTGAAAPGEPVGRAVALFAARTWPGEALSDGERRALARHACEAAGIADTEDGKRKTEDGIRKPGDGGREADGEGQGIDRRMGAALDVARRTRRPEARRLAKCGALRPFDLSARPGGRTWSLDLSPMTDGCPLELGAYRRLRAALEGIADLWEAGDRPVLVLCGLARWPGGTGDPSDVTSYCESVLHRLGTGRGWRGQPEVLRAHLS
ncbi:MAG: hypothetical protein FJ221_12070 [Lentisphaerae bacterium]|nr:hypothetical protein [Lentisphaerota bacterium]